MKEKISVIGIGRLGLSFALLLNSKGYEVCGCDVNEKYIAALNNETFKSDEPQINDMLNSSSMRFTTSSKYAFSFSSLIFIFVPTPSKENGEYDHQYIEQVIDEFEKLYTAPAFKTIIIGCTVMPGYCSELQKRLSKLKVNIIYNPEFIAQGNIINGLKNSDIVLIGGRIPVIVHSIYIAIMDRTPNFKYLSLTGAEIAKISINCFLTMKISFANMIGEIAINSGENNVSDILQTIGSDSRIGNKYLNYGFSSGGVCLPRDQKALGVHANNVGINTTFPTDIDTENKRHAEYLKEYWMKKNPNKDVPFIFSYLGYKKGVNILTESYQLKLCCDLLNEGYRVIIPKELKEMLPSFKYNDTISFEPTKDAIRIN